MKVIIIYKVIDFYDIKKSWRLKKGKEECD